MTPREERDANTERMIEHPAKAIRRQIRELQTSLETKRATLKGLETTCNHDWEKPVYDPIVTGGYTAPGDTPGTMGVDFRGPMYIPRQETPRWNRTCKICGTNEVTTAVEKQVTSTPKF